MAQYNINESENNGVIENINENANINGSNHQ